MAADSNGILCIPLPSQPYKYQALSAVNNMRLLLLVGVSNELEDSLSGFIFTCPLSPDQDYMALSYTWGGEEPSRELKTPDGVLNITPNLDAALRKLRRNCGACFVVWVDAICINQGNAPEKAHQVQLMRQIYENAKGVVAFLGEMEEDSKLALDLLTKISQTKFDTEPENLASFEDLEVFDIPNDKDACWAALRRFLRRPWFRRIWIVQECVVAKHVEIYCGDWNCSFDDILMISMIKIFELQLPILQLNRGNVDQIASDETSRGHNCLGALMLLRRKYQLHEDPDLLTLLDQFQGFEATQARDKFFALLGLSKDSGNMCLKPDYEQPFEEVSIRYTKFLLCSNDPFKVLSLARPQFTNSRFPSWMPDWTKRSKRETLSSFTSSHSEYAFEAATGSQAIAHLDRAGRILTLRGAIFSKTNYLGGDYWSRFCGEPALTILLKIWMDVKKSSEHRTVYVDDKLRLEALWETVTIGRPSGGGMESGAYVASFTAARQIFESLSGSALEEPLNLLNAAEVAFLLISSLLNESKFCIFRNGYIGMVPVTAREGDVVAVLLGARVPFMLRPVPTSLPARYSLVGECYVQGLMKGEAANMPNLKFEDLQLI